MSRRRGWSSRQSDSGTDDDRTRLKEGMKVEARFGGRDKWYKGKITYARSDGTFDILYEDGDTERRVKKRLIRPLKGSSSSRRSRSRSTSRDRDDGKLKEGMKVEARFGGRDKWYKGKITYARSDGTFDILYEDGDTERRVKKRLIRPLKGSSSSRRSRSRSKSRDRDGRQIQGG